MHAVSGFGEVAVWCDGGQSAASVRREGVGEESAFEASRDWAARAMKEGAGLWGWVVSNYAAALAWRRHRRHKGSRVAAEGKPTP